MPAVKLDHDRVYGDALRAIGEIARSTHPAATPGEKLVRIGWVIANIPPELRDGIIAEAQRRSVSGWAMNRKPTEF